MIIQRLFLTTGAAIFFACSACLPFVPFKGSLNDAGYETSPGMLRASEVRAQVGLQTALYFYDAAMSYCSTTDEDSPAIKTGCPENLRRTAIDAASTTGLLVASGLNVREGALYASLGNCPTGIFVFGRTVAGDLSGNERLNEDNSVDYENARGVIRSAIPKTALLVLSRCMARHGSEEGFLFEDENDLPTML